MTEIDIFVKEIKETDGNITLNAFDENDRNPIDLSYYYSNGYKLKFVQELGSYEEMVSYNMYNIVKLHHAKLIKNER